MKTSKRVKNTVQTQRNVKNIVDTQKQNELNQYLRRNVNAVFDFSTGKAFGSCRTGNFDNMLRDEKEFVEKLKETMKAVCKLSQHTIAELFDSGAYRHCHNLEDKADTVLNFVKKIYGDDFVTQNWEEETFYQAGFEDGVRLIGTVKGNVFFVVTVDYFHSLYADGKMNTRSKKTHSYSIGNE